MVRLRPTSGDGVRHIITESQLYISPLSVIETPRGYECQTLSLFKPKHLLDALKFIFSGSLLGYKLHEINDTSYV